MTITLHIPHLHGRHRPRPWRKQRVSALIAVVAPSLTLTGTHHAKPDQRPEFGADPEWAAKLAEMNVELAAAHRMLGDEPQPEPDDRDFDSVTGELVDQTGQFTLVDRLSADSTAVHTERLADSGDHTDPADARPFLLAASDIAWLAGARRLDATDTWAGGVR